MLDSGTVHLGERSGRERFEVRMVASKRVRCREGSKTTEANDNG